MSCKHCLTGVLHEGTPEGAIQQINGVECYVATPSGEYPKDKVILFLTDVFGIPLNNNKLLADGFAKNGFKTVMPDILNGDPIPDMTSPEDFAAWREKNFSVWMPKHGPDSWIPVVDKVVEALKAEGVTRFGTTGYCFGAPPAFYLAFKNESHVTVLSHPSRLEVPADFEKYKAESKAPLLINSCEVDSQFPKESQAIADEILGNGQFAPGYERTYWDGCTHGFAVRGDLSDPKVKAGKEGAFEATVKFYQKYL
ncbi:dienelactone hydrolase endo-1,3,1,4-beta-D-glucanase [Abortiporus biennis]|nr:dienelactone hydrolase endo-1,3,1,4-beta-D-glucanase [Abortiporus biennis]